MKSFRIDLDHEVHEAAEKVDDLTSIEDDEINVQISSIQQNSSKNRNSAVDENNQSSNPLSARRSTRNRRLSTRYQNFVDVIVLLQNETVSSSFVESRRKEVNELLKKNCFEVVFIESILEEIRIFNSRFVNEIKHEKTTAAFENLD